MMIQSRSVFEIDLYIVVATFFLVIIGILFVFSSGVTATGQVASREYIRQIIWVATGLGIMFVLTFIDYRLHYRLAFGFFFVITLLLFFTLFFGRSVSGARRWLGSGTIGIQPSEFAKLALVLVLARIYADRESSARSISVFLLGFGITSFLSLLVLAQPDLGTAMVYIPIFLVVSYFGGARPAYIGYLVGIIAAVGLFVVIPFWDSHLTGRGIPLAPVLTEARALRLAISGFGLALILAGLGAYITRRRVFFVLMYILSIVTIALPVAGVARRVLRDYQIMRLVVFLDPQIDPRGAGWNIIQSTTAVGSGGLFGKGFLQGTQSHYQYLPAQSTDFIFSILAEEWGFIGVVAVFVLFAVIIGRSLYVMTIARDRFAALVVSGIMALFLFHFFVNVGMTIGIMPITGLPLLLLSFGGSSVWTALAGLGIVMSVYQHRYQY